MSSPAGLGMLNVNLHFLGRGFVGYWDDELEQPVAEACLDVFGFHILREGNQALDGPIAELAVKEVALLGFVLLLTRGRIVSMSPTTFTVMSLGSMPGGKARAAPCAS